MDLDLDAVEYTYKRLKTVDEPLTPEDIAYISGRLGPGYTGVMGAVQKHKTLYKHKHLEYTVTNTSLRRSQPNRHTGGFGLHKFIG